MCLYCAIACLDCEDELNYHCDYCDYASCCQGKWHTYLTTYFYYSISVFISMHDRWNIQIVLQRA
jgi:hypothetical protein